MSDPERTRALMRLARHRDHRPYGKRITAAEGRDLLAWAATLPDEEILDMRMVGPTILRWVRDHQPKVGPPAIILHNSLTFDPPPAGTVLGKVLELRGWRVEVFWNSGGGWFTARLLSFPEGRLVPPDDPIGASGQTPGEAFQNLSDAVLEWA